MVVAGFHSADFAEIRVAAFVRQQPDYGLPLDA
jgi:hypothetical protein